MLVCSKCKFEVTELWRLTALKHGYLGTSRKYLISCERCGIGLGEHIDDENSQEPEN